MARQFHRAVPCSVLSVTVMTLSAVSCSLAVSWEIESACTDGRPTSYVFAMKRQREAVAVTVVSYLVWTLSIAQACGSKPGDAATERDSTAFAVGEIIRTLGWSQLTVIGSSDGQTGEDVKDVYEGLSSANVVTLLMDIQLSHIGHLNLSTLSTHSFLVIGSFQYVEGVFLWFRRVAEAQRTSSIMFTSRWIAILAEADIHLLESAVLTFENVLSVVKKKGSGHEVWTSLREGDNCQFKFLSSLPPSEDQFTPQVLFPNSAMGLGGRKLRIVLLERTFFLFKSENAEGKQIYQGVVMDILTELEKKLNFSCVCVQSPDGVWGALHGNEEWDGAIGMLVRNETDMAVGAFSLTPDRSKVADATSPFFHDTSRIIFRKRKQPTRPHHVFLDPFAAPVYPLIAVLFLAVAGLLTVLERCAWRLYDVYTKDLPSNRRLLSWALAGIETMFAGLLNKPVDVKIESHAGNVLMFSWMIFGVVLTSVYSSKLTSSLAVSDQSLPFSSLSELVRQSTYTWGVAAGTAKESVLKTSPVPEQRAFYEGVLHFEKTDPEVLSPNLSVHKAKVFGEAYAFLTGTSDIYDEWTKDIPDITMITVDYMLTQKGFYLQKGSPYTTMVSSEIGRMFEAGVITGFIQKWSPAQNTPSSSQEATISERGAQAIGLREIEAVFYLTGTGVCLAAMALALERLFAWLGRRGQDNGGRMTGPGLQGQDDGARIKGAG